MIRYPYICNHVLQLYSAMDVIEFPIEPCAIIASIQNCKALTYRQFAELNRCSIDKVIQLCQSKSGCTHYEMENDRYLILWNENLAGHNVPGRQRWTKAHELGHVVLRHFPMTTEDQMAENSLNNVYMADCETEADRFAATLLCPMPLFDTLKIKSPVDIMYVFGLSTEAANYRWNEYTRWSRYHKKTAWENDIRSLIEMKRMSRKLKCPPLRMANSERFRGAIIVWKDPDEA